MTFIPDVRCIHKYKVRKDTPDELNPYYEGLVSGKDEDYLQGYDTGVDELINILENFSDSPDVDNLEEIGFDINNVDDAILGGDKNYDEFSEEELEEMSTETKMILIIGQALLNAMERNRNMLVTSLIDQMDNEEYATKFAKFKEDVENGKYQD